MNPAKAVSRPRTLATGNGSPKASLALPRRRMAAGWMVACCAALTLILLITGCAPSPAALAAIPNTGSPGKFEVREYPLVEQSTDNPTHAAFQKRVPEAVEAQRDGWRFPHPVDSLVAANQSLGAFGFRLEANTEPPFSGYTLTRGGQVVQRDIASFWPVSVKGSSSEGDHNFLLPYITLQGEKLLASTTGIYPWPGQAGEMTAPVYYGDQIAYAETSSGGLAVYSGPSLLYSAPDIATGHSTDSPGARSLYSWTENARQHWALEIEGRVIVDGEEVNEANSYEETFGFNVMNGQPLYLATHDGITRISYAGETMPYIYDQVIHNQPGDLQIYNPGSNGRVFWFYALRDGLWYYVEAGLFE